MVRQLLVSDRLAGYGLTAQDVEDALEGIDGSGKTLMPGLTEGHAHISFGDAASTEDLIAPSPEAHTLITARMAGRRIVGLSLSRRGARATARPTRRRPGRASPRRC